MLYLEMFCEISHYGMGLTLPFFQYKKIIVHFVQVVALRPNSVPANAKKYVKSAHCIPFVAAFTFTFLTHSP